MNGNRRRNTWVLATGLVVIIVMAYVVLRLAVPCEGNYEFSLKETRFSCEMNDNDDCAATLRPFLIVGSREASDGRRFGVEIDNEYVETPEIEVKSRVIQNYTGNTTKQTEPEYYFTETGIEIHPKAFGHEISWKIEGFEQTRAECK